jgi:hypothetical protein
MSIIETFLHWFTPRHTNAHRAKILHQKSLLYIIALFLIAEGAIYTGTRIAPQILGYASNIPPEKIIELTNTERAKSGLAPLHLDNTLSQAALSKAGYMFANNYWAHVAPDGTQPWTFITNAGYQYLHAGENLARDFTNPESVITAWMNSPSHRDNLLSSKYQDIGVAVVDGTLAGVDTTLVVQMFGTRIGSTPKTSEIAAKSTQILVQPTTRPLTTIAPLSSPTLSNTPRPPVARTEQISASPSPKPVAQGVVAAKPLFNPYSLTRVFTSTIVSIIIIALALDIILVWRRRILRLSGRSWAHITFLAAMLVALIIIRGGNIL